jgi:prepilin-type N-terminal cleavage/methylation domain-containing protein
MKRHSSDKGFTLIELLLAMAVFSFMLLIVVAGFINIVRLHNEALAANLAQDNARVAIDAMVKDVRDSSGPILPGAGPGNILCLSSSSQANVIYYTAPTPPPNSYSVLYRANTDALCSTKTSVEAITSPSVNVADFTATVTSNMNNPKKDVNLSITLGSNNLTTGSTSGKNLACGTTIQDRAFCSVVTLTSGAISR